jgi:hypothetical protein
MLTSHSSLWLQWHFFAVAWKMFSDGVEMVEGGGGTPWGIVTAPTSLTPQIQGHPPRRTKAKKGRGGEGRTKRIAGKKVREEEEEEEEEEIERSQM